MAFTATAGGAFAPASSPIGVNHTATAGLTSLSHVGTVTVTATLGGAGASNGFSRSTQIVFESALPDIITVSLSALTVAKGGSIKVTAHLTRSVGLVTANTVATFSSTGGGFENQSLVQPAAGGVESQATADFLPGANATAGPITITVGTNPPSVAGSAVVTVQ